MLGWILWGQEWKKSEPNDSTRKNRLRYNRERTLQRYIITFAHAQISEYEYHIYTGSSPSLRFLFRFVGWESGTIATRIPDTVFEKKSWENSSKASLNEFRAACCTERTCAVPPPASAFATASTLTTALAGSQASAASCSARRRRSSSAAQRCGACGSSVTSHFKIQNAYAAVVFRFCYVLFSYLFSKKSGFLFFPAFLSFASNKSS